MKYIEVSSLISAYTKVVICKVLAPGTQVCLCFSWIKTEGTLHSILKELWICVWIFLKSSLRSNLYHNWRMVQFIFQDLFQYSVLLSRQVLLKEGTMVCGPCWLCFWGSLALTCYIMTYTRQSQCTFPPSQVNELTYREVSTGCGLQAHGPTIAVNVSGMVI